jgi:hypothetical protein
MNACRSVSGLTGLVMPARRATLRTIRVAPVQPPPIRGQEDRPLGPLADGQVDGSGGARCQRDRDNLAALAGDRQRPVAAFHTESLETVNP